MKIEEGLLLQHHYKQYPQRWFQLFLFIAALVSNIMFGFSLSPIAKQLSIIYGVEEIILQSLEVSFTVFSAIMIIPGNILSEKFGIRANVALGCLLTLIGVIFSFFIKYSFWFLYVGEIISLLGFPFRLISISKFAANWFYPHHRIIVTVVIALIFNASTGISIRIPLWIFGEYDANKEGYPYNEGKSLVEELVFSNGSIILILSLLPILFFKSQPPTPPSFTASDQCHRENYIEAGRALSKNRDYQLLALAFPFILGSILLLTIQMEFIVTPFGYDLHDISNVILLGVFAGLTGDLVVGGAVKKTLKYKAVMRICNALTTVFFVLLIIGLISDSKALFFISYFMVCGCSSIMAVTFEFACEIAFPVSENSSIAFLGVAGNLVNFLQAIPETLILGFNTKYTSIITLLIMLGFISTGNIITYLIQEKLRRLEEDEQKCNDDQKENSLQALLN